MSDHPSSDLAEMTLMADLMKLEAGMFKTKEERSVLVRSALGSVAVLEREGGFSRGEQALAEIAAKLRALV